MFVGHTSSPTVTVFSPGIVMRTSAAFAPVTALCGGGAAAASAVESLTRDAKPTLLCAYGEEDAIQIAGTGGFVDLDPTVLALPMLLQRGWFVEAGDIAQNVDCAYTQLGVGSPQRDHRPLSRAGQREGDPGSA